MYRCSCHILLTKRGKNFSLTLIPTNTEWIDAAFNLVCILKEWEFPAITEGIPKKKKKGRRVYLKMERRRLEQIVLI